MIEVQAVAKRREDPAQLDLFAERPAAAAVAVADPVTFEQPKRGGGGVSRPYQEAAADCCEDVWLSSRGALLVLCTGAGKTFVAGLVARRFLAGTDRDVLFLAHRHELLNQAYAKLSEMAVGTRVEFERAGDFSDTTSPRRPRIIVASKDTLWRPYRLERFERDRFGIIVIDEAHHAARRSSTYSAILDYFEGYKLLGLTATPRRADNVQLGQVFGEVAYVYPLQQAINDGWLVPIVQKLATVAGYDLSEVSSGKHDLNEAELADVMRKDSVLHGVAHAAVKYSNHGGQRRPTIVFCASVTHARLVSGILNSLHAERHTGAAAAIWSSAKDAPAMPQETRDDILAAYRSGEVRYLCNYAILAEGTDLPNTRVVVIARATSSRALYTQMAGRVVRPASAVMPVLSSMNDPAERRAYIAASEKPAGVIVDLMGVSGYHKLITAVDLLGGDYEPEVVREAKARAAKQGGLNDIQAALLAAKKERESRDMMRRSRVVMDVQLTERDVDPFNEVDCPVGDQEPGWFKGRRATAPQRSLLSKMGFTERELAVMTVWQASRLIDVAVKRRRDGLCTIQQGRLLKKYGYDSDMPRDEARRILDELAAKGWRQ